MDEKEKLKRQNYFDLKRDETMALNEYLLSPISEIDLRKMNEGGMMSMENMTMPLGYDRGTRDGTLVGDKEAMIKAFNLSNKENRIKKEGRVSDMDRMMMLQASMRDEENQRMTDPDITSVALQIAKQQGDSSEKNINLIINQLTALMPSLTKTMEKELTPLSTQGLKYLFDKMNIMAGKKSDPMLRRDVGFERVE